MLKVGKGRGQEWRHGQTHSHKQHEARTKRVSFKPQASLLQEKKRTMRLPTKDKTSLARSVSRALTTNPTNSVASLMPTRHSLTTENHYSHSVEMVASLPANHPNRIIPFSCIPRTFPPPKPVSQHRIKVPSNPLVFGGSFPIDDPISPRQLGSGGGKAAHSTLPNTPRTYQVDTLCCQAPNLCDEHAKLGHDTELARATARWEAAQNKANHMDEEEDDEDGEDGDDEEEDEVDESSLNTHPITTTTATTTTPCQLPAPSLGFPGACKSCSGPCSPPRHPAPRQPVLTYPVDGHVEGGLIPLTDDDDYDYQEEYDEYGEEVYQYEDDYEEEEEECEETMVMVEGIHRQPTTDSHLRQRHRPMAPSGGASSSPSPDTTTTTYTAAAAMTKNLASVEISHSNTSTTPLSSPPPLLPLSPPLPLLQLPTHPPPPPPPLLPSPTTLVGDEPHPPSPPNCLAPQSGGTNPNTTNDTKDTQNKDAKSEEDKKKSAGKESKAANAKGGWLTSLLGWKSSTKQAYLPPDENPRIVWNPDTEKWENKDGTEETSAPVGPPPKMPQLARGLPPSVSRNTNRMTRYVDPMKDKAAPPPGTQPSPMLPPMPMTSPSISPSLMIPQPMQPSQESKETGNTSPQPQPQPQQQHQQQPPQVPEVAQMRRTRYISESSIELEDDWPPAKTEGTLSEEARGPVPMMAPPMGQPQFFNPSQFKPSPGTPINPARRSGPGRRSFPANR